MAEERERQFKYRWDRTWADVPEEYLAFDGDVKIGCVHRLNSISAGGWYWAMNAAPNGLARSAARSKAATKPAKRSNASMTPWWRGSRRRRRRASSELAEGSNRGHVAPGLAR